MRYHWNLLKLELFKGSQVVEVEVQQLLLVAQARPLLALVRLLVVPMLVEPQLLERLAQQIPK